MPDLPQRIREELEALDKLREEDIDYSDIPQITDWSNAVRGGSTGHLAVSQF